MERTEVVEPRPEARPLHWSEMTQEQQDATRRLGTFIRRLAEASFKPMPAAHDTHGFLPPIDTTRRNNVFLFDGGRGSGKTALVVTHLDVWSWGVRNKPKDHAGGVPEEGIQNELEPLGQVVPVGLLDLQPLPKGANLLVYIASRFKRVVEAVQRMTGHTQVTKPWHAADPETAKSARQWRMFMNAAAAGWEGSLEGRRAVSDPAAFAVEFEESEDQRLEVIPQFRRLIDALVVDYARLQGWPENKLPLFVLGIDDADMNVQRSTEVLDVIRALWHPRIAFVLTGDSELFEAALEVRTENELAAPSRKIVASGERLVRTLPRDIYNKIIPPLHRFELRPLFPGERRRLLNDWLSKVEGKRARDRIAKVKALFDIYPLLETALPGRLRPLQDFALWVGTIQDDKDVVDEGLVEARVLHYLWKSALHENLLPELKTWVVEDDQRRIVVSVPSTHKCEFVVNALPAALPSGKTINVCRDFELQFTSASGVLPQSLTACLLVLTDLHFGGGRRKILIVNPYQSDPSAFELVVLQGFEELTYSSWPQPRWSRFANLIQFRERWRATFNAGRGTNGMAALAHKYLSAILGIANDKTNLPSWQTYAEALKRTVSDTNIDAGVRAWARTDAVLLAAPESGLDAEHANAFLLAVKNTYSDDEWQQIRPLIIQQRHDRLRPHVVDIGLDVELAEVGEDRFKKFLRMFQLKHLDYEWSALVEPHSETTLLAIFRRMRQIHVPGDRSAGMLSAYLTPFRVQELNSAPAAMLEKAFNAVEVLSKQAGSAGLSAIEMLWQIMTNGAPESLRNAVAYPGQLTMHIDAVYEFTGRPKVAATSNRNLLLDSRTTDKVPLRLSAGYIEWTPEKQIAKQILAMLRMVSDIQSDTNLGSVSPFEPWWPIANGALGDDPQHRYPWPAPAWPTFLDWERCVNAWNEKLIPQVSDLAEAARNTGGSQQPFADEAAYWYVTIMEHTLTHRCDLGHVEFSLQSELDRWRGNIQRWFGQLRNSHNKQSAHWRVFEDWVERIPLLAAPESGLSQPVAESILSGIPDLTQRRETLAALRHRRTEYMGLSPRTAMMTLKKIDADFQTHPWIRLIENPLAQETATPKPPKS